MERSQFEHVFHNTSKLFESPTDKDKKRDDKLLTSPSDYIFVDDERDDERDDREDVQERNTRANNYNTDDVEKVPPLEIDLFMTNVYKFFRARGFKNILITQIINLLFVTFLVSFVIFLLVCVDIKGLLSIKDSETISIASSTIFGASMTPGTTTTTPSISDYIYWSNLGHMHWYMAITTTLFVLFMVWRSLRVAFDIHKMYRMKHFFENELEITDFELSTIRWQTVIDKMKTYQEHSGFYLGKDEINAHNLANRILKKENYMIAMINNDLFDFKIPFIKKWWDVPFLTKSMEWNLQYGIINFFFDDRMKLKRDITVQSRRSELISNLRKRVRLICIGNILLLPFLCMIYAFWTIFENGEQLYKTPGKVMKRTWNTYARWKFRDFNEFPHVLEERLRQSEKYGDEYMSQFSSHWLSTCAKFASFIMSTFLISLFLLSLFNGATLFNLEISSGRSVFWYIGIFSTLLLVSRSLEIQKTIFSPKKKMTKLAKFIHYVPDDWIENANSESVKTEISRLYEYRFIILFKELIGMLLNPFLMWFNLDKNVDKIVDFMRNYTHKHPDIGCVCKFGIFDDTLNGKHDLLNSTQVVNMFDVEVPIDNSDMQNQKKLEASVRNFNENFPHQSQTSVMNNNNNRIHIMESNLFDLPVEVANVEVANLKDKKFVDPEEQLDSNNTSNIEGSSSHQNESDQGQGFFSFNTGNTLKKL
jgi:autophagy-related protein 9